MNHPLLVASIATSCIAASAPAQQIAAAFSADYSVRSIGGVPGVPPPYGGVTFRYDDLDVLLIGGAANSANGGIYQIRVARDSAGDITGFVGSATLLSTAPNIDGGLAYGPQNTLFFTQYPISGIGQVRPGSTTPDRTIALSSVGFVGSSPGSLTFVPPGFAAAGHLKIASYSSGNINDATLAPDGTGTFDLNGVGSTVAVSGGPEGIMYPPPGSPGLVDYTTMMVCEYNGQRVSVYDIGSTGDPILASRRDFLTGVAGIEGATVDAARGGFLFSTFTGGDQIYVVDGFASCGTFTNYGSGIPDLQGNTPTVRGLGCLARRQAIRFEVGNGPAGAIGALHLGFTQLQIPLFGGFVLATADVPFVHTLDSNGAWGVTVNAPDDPNLVGLHLYLQAAYITATAPFGVMASGGLDALIL